MKKIYLGGGFLTLLPGILSRDIFYVKLRVPSVFLPSVNHLFDNWVSKWGYSKYKYLALETWGLVHSNNFHQITRCPNPDRLNNLRRSILQRLLRDYVEVVSLAYSLADTQAISGGVQILIGNPILIRLLRERPIPRLQGITFVSSSLINIDQSMLSAVNFIWHSVYYFRDLFSTIASRARSIGPFEIIYIDTVFGLSNLVSIPLVANNLFSHLSVEKGSFAISFDRKQIYCRSHGSSCELTSFSPIRYIFYYVYYCLCNISRLSLAIIPQSPLDILRLHTFSIWHQYIVGLALSRLMAMKHRTLTLNIIGGGVWPDSGFSVGLADGGGELTLWCDSANEDSNFVDGRLVLPADTYLAYMNFNKVYMWSIREQHRYTERDLHFGDNVRPVIETIWPTPQYTAAPFLEKVRQRTIRVGLFDYTVLTHTYRRTYCGEPLGITRDQSVEFYQSLINTFNKFSNIEIRVREKKRSKHNISVLDRPQLSGVLYSSFNIVKMDGPNELLSEFLGWCDLAITPPWGSPYFLAKYIGKRSIFNMNGINFIIDRDSNVECVDLEDLLASIGGIYRKSS